MENKTMHTRYLVHLISFPDGDNFIEQHEFVHALDFEAKNWQHTHFRAYDNATEMIKTLLKKGELKFETPSPFGPAKHWYLIKDEKIKE